MQDLIYDYTHVLDAYQVDNWGKMKEFQGDFINFGFWDSNNNSSLSITQRIAASQKLYEIITFKYLNALNPGSSVLEIGFGFGAGLIFLARTFPHLMFYGIDLTPRHYFHTKELTRHTSNIMNLYNSALENSDIDLKFDFVFSIEAIQHIINFDLFINKIKKILNKSACLCLAAHLANGDAEKKIFQKNIPFSKIDIVTPITTVSKIISKNNFNNISIQSIGENVFPGYEKWINHIGGNPNSSLLYDAFMKKIIDYYIISSFL